MQIFDNRVLKSVESSVC